MFGQGSPSYVELSKLNAVQEGGEEEEEVGVGEGDMEGMEGVDSSMVSSSSAAAAAAVVPSGVASLKTIGTKVRISSTTDLCIIIL